MDAKRDEKYLSGDENARGRGDMGDDGGTRVGRPTPAPHDASEGATKEGPSSRTVSEGLEGAVLEGDQQSTGAGAEAARGTHGRQGQDTSMGSGPDEDGGGSPRGGSDRRGSEPLAHNREHTPGYGGEGGTPRTSSNEREPQTPE